MIVYGDPQFASTLDALREGLLAHLDAWQDGTAPATDELRTLLILLGQLEQAVADLPDAPADDGFQTATDIVAGAFVAALSGVAPARSYGVRIRELLGAVRLAGGTPLTVKVPEGFAFYTLYPEQYHTSALRWAAACTSSGPVVVAGIRSIGTSLAAVVAQTLAAQGRPVRRLSLRPRGHAFGREAYVDPAMVAGAAWGLVVDEGPGMSGSSMAASAAALERAGIERSRIVFLPSHGDDPGGAQSEQVAAWWRSTPRFCTLLADLRLAGHTLAGALAAATTELIGEPVTAIDDCGGGIWRNYLYTERSEWPAAYAPFERTKYRCTTAGGAGLLWKFGGLAGGEPGSGLWQSMANAEASRLADRADRGIGQRPVAVRHGFVALPWVAGTPLCRADATPRVLDLVGHTVARLAGPPLDSAAQRAGMARLAEMLYWNTWELLGEESAAQTRPIAEAATAAIAGPLPGAGDERQAPHEWLRRADGTILKTDTGDHSFDHTIVGPQPIAWDLAAATVEWELDAAGTVPLFAGYLAAGGPSIAPQFLRFYTMAYLAFRAGQARMCAVVSGHDPDEQARLWAAHYRYSTALRLALAAGLRF
jgi:hypothetical protein